MHLCIFNPFYFQIWELVDTRQGYLSRTGLYKALALVAFAQQGKSVSEKLIQNFTGEGMINYFFKKLAYFHSKYFIHND